MILLVCFICRGQEKLTLTYVGSQYKETKNKSFINREFTFLDVSNDTLYINLRMAFDVKNPQLMNPNIYYNAHLKKSEIYTITLRKICIKDIPETLNSYYITNTIPDEKDCSRFIEIENNTKYNYTGNYGKYVDIDGVLYEVDGVTPCNGCFFQH
ncbi:MAG: hypothetical protein EAZ55_13220 [Cytophagales bacterium]|nr:MAG: hypothetical protein EAZ55_13220 [Cytophagales bacterium]